MQEGEAEQPLVPPVDVRHLHSHQVVVLGKNDVEALAGHLVFLAVDLEEEFGEVLVLGRIVGAVERVVPVNLAESIWRGGHD